MNSHISPSSPGFAAILSRFLFAFLLTGTGGMLPAQQVEKIPAVAPAAATVQWQSLSAQHAYGFPEVKPNKKGTLTLNSPLAISQHAAEQKPTNLHLWAGDQITVENAIKAIVIRSANDVAVAIAEGIGGTTFNEAFSVTGTVPDSGSTALLLGSVLTAVFYFKRRLSS